MSAPGPAPSIGPAYERTVRSLLAGHGAQHAWAGHMAAAYIPRFFGLRSPDVFASPLTEDEARLAVARQFGFPSWNVMLQRVEENVRLEPGDWQEDPMRRAAKAMEALDLQALTETVRWLL